MDGDSVSSDSNPADTDHGKEAVLLHCIVFYSSVIARPPIKSLPAKLESC